MITLIFNTFKEKVRSKTLYITGIIGIVLMILITTGDGLSINGQKILSFQQRVPVAMTLINLIGCLLAVMISMHTIPNEFERKTTHLILVRGIKPWQYMFSMTVGNVVTSMICIVTLYGSLILFCLILGKGSFLILTMGSILILSLNVILLSCIVSVLSIKVPVFINGVVCILIYFLGVFHDMLSVAAGVMRGTFGMLARFIVNIIPDFAAVQKEASNLLLSIPVDIYPILIQLLYIYIVLSFSFILFRKEV